MAKYKAYPEYKDSGVEWLGEVPTHWQLIPCRAVVSHIVDKNDNGKIKNYLSLMANVGVIRYEDKGDIGNKKPDDLTKCKIVKKGQLVINSMNYGIGSYGMSPFDGVCSSVYIILEPKENILKRYALRIFENTPFQKHLATFGNGILEHRAAIKWDDIKGQAIPLPCKDEQRNILKFLDHQTARIDDLIEKQQQLIELLKEKRQAVISHAVTKGLNPDVPMKDSGVEWLEYIPEHWEQSRIGWMCNVGNGCTPSRENTLYWQNGSYPWLNSSKVNDERILTAEQFVTTKALYECSLPIVKKGSVIMAITGEGKTRGTSALMMINATINQHVAYITPRAKDKISSEFIHLWLQSKYQQIRTSSEGWGSTKAAITCSDVKCYPIPVPPLKEQAEIVRAIEEKKTIFTNLLLSCEKEIEILQERRTALISAAVTGKIDVRDWVAPDTQDVEEPQEATV